MPLHMRRMRPDWGGRGQASVLVGGQFGSEGKGLAAAYLAERALIEHHGPRIATTNAGAQAGHTTCYADGRKFVCFHLPTAGVVHSNSGGECQIYVNAGSIIDVDVLLQEVIDRGIAEDDLTIHPRAVFIKREHTEAERARSSAQTFLGSTQKGVGVALSHKVLRQAQLVQDCPALQPWCNEIDLNGAMAEGTAVFLEVPQGFDLSINHGLSYPHVTSRDCWVGSGMSDAGIHPEFLGPVCMVMRTKPIRVGHIYSTELGRSEPELIGDSGPFWSDSRELDWDIDLPGIEPERTTVTKRVRRIASWSNEQYARALRFNRPSIVFINFMNYLNSKADAEAFIFNLSLVEDRVGVEPAHFFGFGPNVEDVTESEGKALTWYDHRRF